LEPQKIIRNNFPRKKKKKEIKEKKIQPKNKIKKKNFIFFFL